MGERVKVFRMSYNDGWIREEEAPVGEGREWG
jgi:hypothetical protein